MDKNFWKKLKRSSCGEQGRTIFALAPMHEVADTAFRRIVAKIGKPDLMFTEMISADGLVSEGKKAFLPLLKFSGEERPLVCQLFGARPENFAQAANIVAEMGFDGIDINMGCPQDKILKQGAGAALIKNPELAKKIISETKKGAGDLPVSVKTRLGWDKNIIGEWMRHLLETEPAAISIHGRTKKQMFGGEADWRTIKEAVEIIKLTTSDVVIFGNGDIKSIEEGIKKAKMSGVDGIMIGRATLGNPWIFINDRTSDVLSLDVQEKMKVMLEHARLFEEVYKEKNGELSRNFNMLKKHFCAYASGFDGAKELRMKLMEARNAGDVEEAVKESGIV